MSIATALTLTATLAWMAGQDNSPKAAAPTAPLAGTGDAARPDSPAPSAEEAGRPLSEAERISRLRRAVEAAQNELGNIQAKLQLPDGEYRQAEAAFQTLDQQFVTKKKALAQARQQGPASGIPALEEEVKALAERWQRAQDRFTLAIEERKRLQTKAAALQQKMRHDQEALDRLTSAPPTAVAPPPEAATVSQPPASPPGAAVPTAPQAVGPVPPSATVAPAATPPSAAGAASAAGVAGAADAAPAAPAAPAAAKPPSRALQEAQRAAQAKKNQAEEAQRQADTVNERVESLRAIIAAEKNLLDTLNKKAATAQKSESRLAEDLQRSLVEDPAAIDDVREEIAHTSEARQTAEQGMKASNDRLHELHGEVQQLLAEQATARHMAEHERAESEKAEKRVAEIENPFATRNVLAWMASCLPKLLVILLCMYLLHRGVRHFGQRVVRLMAHSGERGSEQDRENRARTLVGVFRNAASLLILGGGSLMLLDALSIPILPLMGGAAVFGLAVAFGAQNLIRDYFSGFMVLLEDQYSVNDVVKIGETSGLVEKITLRVTVLRDMAGVVHFVPHGAISTVSNLTHGWSRAFFHVGVAYKENVDHVMDTLLELGRALRRDPKFGALILENPEMLGVDDFAESAVVIKFYIKTRPLQQWPVKRELLRRIKNKFDELGIEIPVPHRTIYHRHEGESVGPEQVMDARRPSSAA